MPSYGLASSSRRSLGGFGRAARDLAQVIVEIVLQPKSKHVGRSVDAPVDFSHAGKFNFSDFGRVGFWFAAQHPEIHVYEFVFHHASAQISLVAREEAEGELKGEPELFVEASACSRHGALS